MQEPFYPSFHHSTNLGDAGNSFVATLYGSPSLLQCDFQELSDRNLCTSSGNSCTAVSGNFGVDSMNGGTLPIPSHGLRTEHYHKLQSRPDAIPDISSRALTGLSSSSHSVFHDVQSSNVASQPTFPGGKKAREPFSYRGKWCSTRSHASSLNVCGSAIQTMPNMVLEQCPSKHNSIFMSGCPRVFCMGKSGYLLLSNTGLLGIVCTCHCLHMSILKFCEHSGLHGINPGDAVHLESGETIAQWKKLYFLMFGIRSQDNGCEWDWPEILLTTGSLMKSNASASNISKSDSPHILSSSAAMLRVKSQTKDSIPATCTTAPNFVGTQLDDVCLSTPSFLDSLKRNYNLSVAQPPSQTPTSPLKNQECIKSSHAKDVLVGKDAASSNIELRLGQPPQAGNPVPSFIEPPLFNANISPLKLHPLKPMANMLAKDEELHNNLCHAAGSFKMVEELPQLKLRKYMSGVSNGLCGARPRSETENVAKGTSFSPLSQSNPQYEVNTKASENLMNGSGPIMSKKQHSEFSIMQVGPTDVLWNSNGRVGRQLNSSATGSDKVLDNDKGVSFAKDSCVKLNSGFGFSKLVEYPRSIARAVSPGDSYISTVNVKICESHNESSLPSDTSVGQNNRLTSGKPIPFERILKDFPFLVSSSTSNQAPLLQQHGSIMDTRLLDESMRILALTQILELSKQQHALHFYEMSQKQGRSGNISEVQPSACKTSISEQFTSGATLKLPQNRGTCGNPETTDDLDNLASSTGLNRYCFSALAPFPLHSKEKGSHMKRVYDLQNEEPSLSLGIDKDNSRSSACENCTEKQLDINLVGKSNFSSGIGPSCYNFKQNFANASGETSLKIASEYVKDQNDSKDLSIPNEQGGKLDGQSLINIGSHTHQWRDVPKKVRKADCDPTYLDPSATISDWERQDGQHVNTSAKRLKRIINMEDLLKEQEKSNVSSGCSAPVVTQASVEFNIVDSCTVDAVDTGCVNNLVVDEGSGINKGWSPNVVESERSADFLGSTCESYLNEGYLRVLDDQPCCSLLDDLKLLDSLTWKKDQDRSHMLSGNGKAYPSQKLRKDLKGKKRKRNKVGSLDASLSSRTPSLLHSKNGDNTGVLNFPPSLFKGTQIYFSSSQERSSTTSSFSHPNTKQKQTAFSSKILSCKNLMSKHHSTKEDRYLSESNSDAEFHLLCKVSGKKKPREDFTSDCHFQMQDPACKEPENAKLKSLSCRRTNAYRITRPIVCGEYGEICNRSLAGEVPKPAKIASLSKVLKTSKKCVIPKKGKPTLTSKRKWKRLSLGTRSERCYGHPASKTKEDSETQNTTICNDTQVRQGDSIINRTDVPSELKSKEIRKQRSIYELTAKETDVKDILGFAEDREHGLCNAKSRNFIHEQISITGLKSDALCSVCRNSSSDDFNCLLECSRCLIRVHQACYGISTLPKKGRWCCRPCRTNSKDIACVLCGYGGGAMTRAILSHTIVKSLLKEWSIEKDGMHTHRTLHKVFEKEIDALGSSKSGLEVDQTFDLMPENVEASRSDLLNVEMSINHMQHAPHSVGNFKVHNSITAGVLDTSVKQWVHMVCGLWTPRTRCPNVDTMSSFDVSDVTRPRAHVVCSICNRRGGSCVKCRVVNCSVKFHPWCAHQKNLLQCETEGADNEKVGFYGTCAVHAIDPRYLSKYDPIDEMGSLEDKEFTCARTEGYKGRKRDGLQNGCYSSLKTKGGCLVPEEQLNAWIHIIGKRLCSQGLPKPASDIEHDCRKEYARYKQANGWKHLIVYKSGIHALGLYTSRFISRGEMVVEYVGEIVGPRVADKREIEYQSGRKVQYKSACYFFRIDKEHIIDATRKGGIARFVNHSCQPNCVAKVITVRHEKKVVFFAERDIYPGEEITYDYHFNNEDEGKKIPCYCNSTNCRRYLN